jgi:hypothetical protein
MTGGTPAWRTITVKSRPCRNPSRGVTISSWPERR